MEKFDISADTQMWKMVAKGGQSKVWKCEINSKSYAVKSFIRDKDQTHELLSVFRIDNFEYISKPLDYGIHKGEYYIAYGK